MDQEDQVGTSAWPQLDSEGPKSFHTKLNFTHQNMFLCLWTSSLACFCFVVLCSSLLLVHATAAVLTVIKEELLIVRVFPAAADICQLFT